MSIRKLDRAVPSSDGIHTLAGCVYLPACTPRGILHVVHGMTEYIGRYDAFMREMAADGWLVCGYDHLGHGHTVNSPEELGYIAPKRGYDLLARDVAAFSEDVRAEYGRDLPYILMGHSMGSFVVRYATEQGYVRPTRLILMGTGGPNPIASVGLFIIRILGLIRGGRKVSPLVHRLAFGTYLKPFKGTTDEGDRHAWLTTDRSVRARYAEDPLCTFSFTISAMGDLVYLTKHTNRPAWARSLPPELPILLVAGGDDPVGSYSKGVRKVADRLSAAGHPTVTHIYEGARHEILNDICHAVVISDIRTFLA